MKVFKCSPPTERMFGSDITLEPTGIEVGIVFPTVVVCFSHDGVKWTAEKNVPFALSLDPRPTARVATDVNP